MILEFLASTDFTVVFTALQKIISDFLEFLRIAKGFSTAIITNGSFVA